MKKLYKILLVLILCLSANGSVLADEQDDLYAKMDSLISIITVYEYGMDRSALSEFSDIVTDELNKNRERNRFENIMTDFLLSNATLDGKQFMCEKLSLVAPERAVLVLLILLKTPETSDMARYALDRIPGITSDVALRDAVESNKYDEIKIGSINSLGSRRDTNAVKVIAEYLSSLNQNVASAAATSLGMIGNEKAAKILSEQLPNYDGNVRDLLADSYLKCADNMLAMGNMSGAEKIYSEVLQSEKNDAVRQAAFNGLLESKNNPVDLIVSTLKGNDLYLIDIAALKIRTLENNGEILKVAALLSDVDPDVKIKILAAFEDMRNPVTHDSVVDAVKDEDELVSSAALNVLSKIGTKNDISLFVSVVIGGTKVSKKSAQDNLDMLNADGVDDEIVEFLYTGNDDMKIELIRSASARKINSAYDAIYAATSSDNKKLKAEAYKALGTVATPENLQDLFVLLEDAGNDGERKRVEASIVAVVGKIPDRNQRADQLIEYMANNERVDVSYSMLRVLAATGSSVAYNVMRSALNGDDEAAQKIVIQSLSNWPGDEPIDDLMNVAKTTSNDTYKILALRSYITLVKRSNDLTDEQKLANYKDALSLSNEVSEKRMIISGLTSVRTLGSLELAYELVADENLRREAFIAVLQIAEDIAYQYPEEVKRVLNKILENTDNENVIGYAKEILNSIK